MAYISRRLEYCGAQVRRRVYKPVYRTFDTKPPRNGITTSKVKWMREHS